MIFIFLAVVFHRQLVDVFLSSLPHHSNHLPTYQYLGVGVGSVIDTEGHPRVALEVPAALSLHCGVD
jgi:hypothetical protein